MILPFFFSSVLSCLCSPSLYSLCSPHLWPWPPPAKHGRDRSHEMGKQAHRVAQAWSGRTIGGTSSTTRQARETNMFRSRTRQNIFKYQSRHETDSYLKNVFSRKKMYIYQVISFFSPGFRLESHHPKIMLGKHHFSDEEQLAV